MSQKLRSGICLFAAVILLLSLSVPCFAAESGEDPYADLFRRAKAGEDVAQELSEAFWADPIVLLNALAAEDPIFADDTVRKISAYHTSGEGNAHYLQKLLELCSDPASLSPEARNILCILLVSAEVDLRNMDESFCAALFSARTDGAASTKAAYIASLCFLQDPGLFVTELSAQAPDVISHYAFVIAFEANDTPNEQPILDELTRLESTELSQEAADVVAAMLGQWEAVNTPVESTEAPTQPTESPTQAPTEPAASDLPLLIAPKPEVSEDDGSIVGSFLPLALVCACALAAIYFLLRRQS